MITLDEDGYIRMRPVDFRQVELIHLVSGINEHAQEKPSAYGGSASRIDGYTEWVTMGAPAISLGWDWWLNVSKKPPVLVRENSPRSNVMLLDACGYDLGPDKTAVLLEVMVDELAWKSAVLDAIEWRYAKTAMGSGSAVDSVRR